MRTAIVVRIGRLEMALAGTAAPRIRNGIGLHAVIGAPKLAPARPEEGRVAGPENAVRLEEDWLIALLPRRGVQKIRALERQRAQRIVIAARVVRRVDEEQVLARAPHEERTFENHSRLLLPRPSRTSKLDARTAAGPGICQFVERKMLAAIRHPRAGEIPASVSGPEHRRIDGLHVRQRERLEMKAGERIGRLGL